MSVTALSGALQDYLRAIYCLEREAGGVSTSLLAERLGVSQPSVTSMLKKLASRKLISTRKENKNLREERDILRKAVAIFSKPPR